MCQFMRALICVCYQLPAEKLCECTFFHVYVGLTNESTLNFSFWTFGENWKFRCPDSNKISWCCEHFAQFVNKFCLSDSRDLCLPVLRSCLTFCDVHLKHVLWRLVHTEPTLTRWRHCIEGRIFLLLPRTNVFTGVCDSVQGRGSGEHVLSNSYLGRGSVHLVLVLPGGPW